MKVFLSSASFLPSYGGPAASVARLAQALALAGLKIGLWAADRSLPSPPSQSGENIEGFRGSLSSALAQFSPTVVHDSGIWLRHNHAIAAFCRKRNVARIVSTRGMLDPWALRYKKTKKLIAWGCYQKRDLQSANVLHATATEESRHLESLGLSVPICVIPNGVIMPDLNICGRMNTHRDTRIALFLGRLHPVKGLPMLVEAWARVRPLNWRLDIAGPDEAGHRKQVEACILRNGLGKSIRLLGPVSEAEKRTTFDRTDLLILPSYSESFGMVVAEALAHAIPVIATDATPWHELDARRCGWCVPTTVDGLTRAICEATKLDCAKLVAVGMAGRDWMECEYGWGSIAERFIAMYVGAAKGAATRRYQYS